MERRDAAAKSETPPCKMEHKQSAEEHDGCGRRRESFIVRESNLKPGLKRESSDDNNYDGRKDDSNGGSDDDSRDNNDNGKEDGSNDGDDSIDDGSEINCIASRLVEHFLV